MKKNFLKQLLCLTYIFCMPLFSKCMEQQPIEDIEQNTSNDEEGWLQDDIVSPTRWIQEETDYPQGLFDDKHKIKARHLYSPAEVSSETSILFIVIHGTWGSKTESYFDDQDKKNQEFRSIKRFAAWYATYNQKNLELLSYSWSGEWKDLSKRTAARKLKEFLDYINPINLADTAILGHGHGCNIANRLSQYDTFKLKPIKLLIYFASPIRKEEEYIPEHYEQLIYFYSDADLVIKLARINEEEAVREGLAIGFIATAGGLFLGGGLMAPKIIAALKGEEIDDLAKSISRTSNAVAVAGFVILTGDTAYTYNKVNNLMKGDNFFHQKMGRITTGLSVKFDGKDKGNLEGHTDIIEVARFLPIILKKLHKKYPAHYASSSTFNLNVDTEKHYDDENSVYITVLNAAPLSNAPRTFYYLANNENAEKSTMLKFEEGNLLVTDNFLNVIIFRNEEAFSKEEDQRFVDKYGIKLTSFSGK